MKAHEELGMTLEQYEQFQALTQGFPHQNEDGVDLSLLRQNLALTPGERLEKLQAGARFLLEIERARTA